MQRKLTAYAVLAVVVCGSVACGGSSPTGVTANFLSTIDGNWAGGSAIGNPDGGQCFVTARLDLTASATGQLTGTASLDYCSFWQSGTVAITAGSSVNPKTGAIVVNAAAPLGNNFFVGGVQARVTSSGTTDTGLIGTITADGQDWILANPITRPAN